MSSSQQSDLPSGRNVHFDDSTQSVGSSEAAQSSPLGMTSSSLSATMNLHVEDSQDKKLIDQTVAQHCVQQSQM